MCEKQDAVFSPSLESASTMQSTKQNLEGPEREGSESSKWSNLPQDISESILKLLSLRDYLQFGRVCTSWRATVANAVVRKHCLPAPQLPLLFLNGGPDSKITYPCFFDLSKQKIINPKRLIYERSQYCCGSFEGWFFIVDNDEVLSCDDMGFSITLEHELSAVTDVVSYKSLEESHGKETPTRNPKLFVLNPVSGDRIVLPSLSNITPYINPKEPRFTKLVASSSPDCQDCIIVGLLETCCHLAVCKLDNKCWTMIEAKETMVFLDIEIIGKTLYVLVDDGEGESTIFYDLEDANAPKLNMLVSLEHKPELRIGITTALEEGGISYVTDCDLTYLARDDVSGELLMIRMLVDYCWNIDNSDLIRHVLFINEYVTAPHAKEFRVWKLDKRNHQWLELNDLDGRSLYFRASGSIVISNTSLNGPEEFVKGNCIYFACSCEDEKGSLQIAIARFCMTDKSMEPLFPGDLSAAHQAMNSGSFWFMPKYLLKPSV